MMRRLFQARFVRSAGFGAGFLWVTAGGLASEPASPELAAYVARSDESVEGKFLSATDHFIHRGKAAGWWQELTAVYVLCGPSLKVARLNLKMPRLDWKVVGEVTMAPLTGVTSDGRTGYFELEPPAKIPGFTLEAHSLFVYSQTDRPALAGEIGASGGTNVGVRARNAVLGTAWSASKIPMNQEIKTGQGFSGFVRRDASSGFLIKDAITLPFLQEAKSLPTGPLRLLTSGGANLLSRNQLAFAFIGSGKITEAQAVDLGRACTEMLDALGTRAAESVPQPATPPHAFSRETLQQVTPAGLEIFRIAAPPARDDTNFATDYRYGPINQAVLRPWGEVAESTDTQVARWELIWSDRSLGPRPGVQTSWAKKPNDTMRRIVNTKGEQCRTEFESYEKAIGSTLVKTAYSAGLRFRGDPSHPDHKGWGDLAEEWGYDVSAWEERWRKNPDDPIFTRDLPVDTGPIVHRAFCADPKNVDAFFSHNAVDGVFKTSRDRVILGPGRLADIKLARGFVIDHEHADDRSPELQLKFITEMSKIAHAKGLQLGASAHPPTHGAGEHGGWTKENAFPILQLLDWITLISPSETPAGGQRAFLQEQYDYFRGDRPESPEIARRFCVQIQIGGPGQEMSLADARTIREFMIEKGIPRCFLSNAYAMPGGPRSRAPNQVVAAFLGLPLK